jgi:hypothetical protein
MFTFPITPLRFHRYVVRNIDMARLKTMDSCGANNAEF